MNEFDFALCTDRNYLKITLACINNLIEKKSESAIYNIHLIVTEAVEANDLLVITKCEKVNINLIIFDYTKLQMFEGIRHVSKTAYSKFFIPSLIDANYVLYLDGDVYINQCVEKLWELIPLNCCVGAVADPGYTMDNQLIGIGPKTKTFNSGILFFNCQQMRQENIEKKLMEFYNAHHKEIKNADQTVFNAVLKGKWKELDDVYNLQRAFYLLSSKTLGVSKEDKQRVIKAPIIIHFTTHSKPWMFRCGHPYKNKYMKNYCSIFGKYKEQDRNFKGLVKRIYEEYQYRVLSTK